MTVEQGSFVITPKALQDLIKTPIPEEATVSTLLANSDFASFVARFYGFVASLRDVTEEMTQKFLAFSQEEPAEIRTHSVAEIFQEEPAEIKARSVAEIFWEHAVSPIQTIVLALRWGLTDLGRLDYGKIDEILGLDGRTSRNIENTALVRYYGRVSRDHQ